MRIICPYFPQLNYAVLSHEAALTSLVDPGVPPGLLMLGSLRGSRSRVITWPKCHTHMSSMHQSRTVVILLLSSSLKR